MRATRYVLGAVLALAIMLLVAAPALAMGGFPDVPGDDPYAAAIDDLAGKGIVHGYADGDFGPGDSVIRQQFAKMIVLSLDLPISDANVCPFADVQASEPGNYLDPTDPNYPDHYIAVCATQGITKGKTPITFAPYGTLTHEQLITMVARAAGLPEAPAGFVSSFSAAQFSFEDHYLQARKAEAAGLLAGLKGMGANYDFLAPATRGECAQLLYNLIRYLHAGPFSLNVIPETLRGDSIPGQHVVYLVTITEQAGTSTRPVILSAIASGAEVEIVRPQIAEGQVAEIWVTPKAESAGQTLELAVQGSRAGLTQDETSSFAVAQGEDGRAEKAGQLLDTFVAWLAEEHPELGITTETEWHGTMVSPIWLVVEHYLFFSAEWEIHLDWHVMIPPYDWSRIDLRKRFSETKPSLAFEISSVSGGVEPQPYEVPGEIWR